MDFNFSVLWSVSHRHHHHHPHHHHRRYRKDPFVPNVSKSKTASHWKGTNPTGMKVKLVFIELCWWLLLISSFCCIAVSNTQPAFSFLFFFFLNFPLIPHLNYLNCFYVFNCLKLNRLPIIHSQYIYIYKDFNSLQAGGCVTIARWIELTGDIFHSVWHNLWDILHGPLCILFIVVILYII